MNKKLEDLKTKAREKYGPNTSASSASSSLSAIPAPKMLLMGAPGSGKTHSILSLLDAGIEVFVVSLDSNGLDTLLDHTTPERLALLHYKQFVPQAASWASLLEMAQKVDRLSFAELSQLKSTSEKSKARILESFLTTFNNFICDRTGESFGDVLEWNDQRALVIDGLSGVNRVCQRAIIGHRPTSSQGEWGVAMEMEMQIIEKFCDELRCWFVLIAHVEREVDEVLGTQKIMCGALGRKIAPKMPGKFSEVVLAERTADKFTWSTASVKADVKNRGLPIASDLPPSFASLVEVHKRRVQNAQHQP